MQFYKVWNTWDAIGKNKEYYKLRGWKRYYTDMLNGKPLDEIDNFVNRKQLPMEYLWFMEGKVYYKIWPGVLDEFIKTRIDIDSELLRPAHKVFAIRLPKMEESLEVLNFKFQDKMAHVQTLLVISLPMGTVVKDLKLLQWRITYGVQGYQNPGNFILNTTLKPGDTIEKSIGDFTDIEVKDTFNTGHTVGSEVLDACLRLLVATHFLSTGSHKILEFDVLNKHLQKYRDLEKNDPKRKKIEAESKRKGKFGYNVGRGQYDRMLKLPRGVTYAEAMRKAGGRERLYQHIRGGHWHTVLFGPNRSKKKVVWFDSTVVRPDLMPRPIE